MTPHRLLVLGLAATACGLLGPIENRVVGRVELRDGGEPSVVVPGSATPGRPFNVTVLTAGGGCSRQGDTEVVIDSNTAIVTPFDIEIIPRDGAVCPGYLVFYEHVAQVEMPREGEGVVVIRARDFPSDTAIELRHTVTVF
jgi:hypothetical protein